MVETLLAINLVRLLEALETKVGVKLPRKVVEVSLTGGVLHVRFEHLETSESDVEPLPTSTPAFLFRDEKTGENHGARDPGRRRAASRTGRGVGRSAAELTWRGCGLDDGGG